MLHEQMTKIVSFYNGAEIFLSGVESVIYGENDLYNNNIHTVLSFLEEYHKPDYFHQLPSWISHYYTSIKDQPSENIEKYFLSSYKIIKDSLQSGKSVLIHCRAGISRSVTILIAFFLRAQFFCPAYSIPNLIKSDNTWTETILNYIRIFRPIANPNPGFYERLLKYEISLLYNLGYKIQFC